MLRGFVRKYLHDNFPLYWPDGCDSSVRLHM
jgi:hypothetical protein